MNETTLAGDLVAFLTPFLPYLLKAGKAAGKEAAKKIGELYGQDVWKLAKTLWARLSPKIDATPNARDAVNDVVNTPRDQDAQAALRLQIRKLLAEDEDLTNDLALLWEQAKAIGERSVVATNILGSTIITGNRNVLQQGKYNVNIGNVEGVTISDEANAERDIEVNDKPAD